jgi:Chaperone of endosialidase
MGLETATYIKDLVPSNPTATDFVNQGDDHLRLIKSVLQSTFPALCGPALPTVGGTANAITLTYPTAPGSNLAGEIIYFTPTAPNTGPVTISVNGNPALPLNNQGAALVGGELQAGRVYQAMVGSGATAFNLISSSLINSGLTIAGPAGTSRPLFFDTGNLARWAIYANANAESGSNAGSDFIIQRYNDAGVAIDSPFQIVRSTGLITLPDGQLFVGVAALAASPIIGIVSAVGQTRSVAYYTGANPRWTAGANSAPEGGSNAGSDFGISRYSDAGNFIDAPLTIIRATGAVTLNPSGTTQPLYLKGSGGTSLVIDKVASGNAANIIGETAGSIRWVVNLGNNTAESGSNVGSDFQINRYSDAGAAIDAPLTISRASGVVTLASNPVISPASGQALISVNAINGQQAQVMLSQTGIRAWAIINQAVSGQFVIYDQTAGSAALTFATTHDASFTGRIIPAGSGFACKAGAAGAVRGNNFNIDYTGSVAQLWIDTTNFGTFAFTSDYRHKRDIEPLPSMWERIKALKPISYKHKDYTPEGSIEPLIVGDDKERWGFVAHELQETLIEDAAHGHKDEENVIQSPNPWTVIATLTKALQEAMTRIEALEAKLAGV